MQDFTEIQSKLPFYYKQCDVSTGLYLPVIHPTEALHNLKSCSNPLDENVITCKSNKLKYFLDQIDGLSLNINLNSSIEILPFYIPMLNAETMSVECIPDKFEYVGLSLKDLLKSGFTFKKGSWNKSGKIKFRDNYLSNEIFRIKKVILFMTGEDILIEEIWNKRFSIGLYDFLKEINLFAVTGFNFSVFGGECPVSQVLNQKRSIHSSLCFEQIGLKTIPHIYILNSAHLERYKVWLNDNSSLNYVLINCQYSKSKSENQSLISSVINLVRQVPHIHIILQGLKYNYIPLLLPIIDNIHFADKAATFPALNYREIYIEKTSAGYKIKKRRTTINRNELIQNNIIVRDLFYKSWMNLN